MDYDFENSGLCIEDPNASCDLQRSAISRLIYLETENFF